MKVVALGRKMKGRIKSVTFDCPECNCSRGLKSEDVRALANVGRTRGEKVIPGGSRVGHSGERPVAWVETHRRKIGPILSHPIASSKSGTQEYTRTGRITMEEPSADLHLPLRDR